MEKYLVYCTAKKAYNAYIGEICSRNYSQTVSNTPANLKQFEKAGYIRISRKDFTV